MLKTKLRINKFLCISLFLIFSINPLLSEIKSDCDRCSLKKKCGTEQFAQSQSNGDEFSPLDESEQSKSSEEEFQPLDSSNSINESNTNQSNQGESINATKWTVPLLALFFTIIAGIFVRFRTTRNLRGVFLIASIALLGFLNGACPCPISSFGNFVLAISGSPFHWYEIIWFLALIPITYIFGKVWCGWVCHLGALQELLYLPAKIKPLKNQSVLKYIKFIQIIFLAGIAIHISILITNMFWKFFSYSILLDLTLFGTEFKFTFVDALWVLLTLLLISFVLRHSEKMMKVLRIVMLVGFLFWLIGEDTYLFNKYDPFKTAFNLGYNASQTEWILLVLMLLSSIFLQRPFCKTICPIGLVLGWIPRIPGSSVLGHNEKCNGCKFCSISCKNNAIQRKEGFSILDNEECIGCGECVDACKLDSLKFYRKSSKRPVVVSCKREVKDETVDAFFEKEFPNPIK